MHPGEVQPGEIHKGIMAGEDELLRRHPSPRRDQPPVLHPKDGGPLIDRQRLRRSPQEFQRVELGLPVKTQGPGGREGEGDRLGKGGREPQGPGAFRLPLQGLPVRTVDIGALLLKIAVDAPFRHPAPVFLHGPLAGCGVSGGPGLPQGADQLPIDRAVLGGDLRRGAACLPAADPPRLQKEDPDPGFLQGGGDEDPRHPGADDGHLRFPVSLQGRPCLRETVVPPDGAHSSFRSAAGRSFSTLSRPRSVSMTG